MVPGRRESGIPAVGKTRGSFLGWKIENLVLSSGFSIPRTRRQVTGTGCCGCVINQNLSSGIGNS